MRALKILVVLMGVLLVAGTVVLVIAVVERASHRVAANSVAPPPGRGFGQTVIDLPDGAKVLGVEAAADRLVIRLELAQGGEALLLVDPKTGARLGTIELRPSGQGEDKP